MGLSSSRPGPNSGAPFAQGEARRKDIALPHAVSGLRRETDKRAGRLSYYVAGEGPPLLLVHSVNAAASVYEVRPIYEKMKAHRRVFAVDLPGFGFSERSDRDYTPKLYVAAILDMLDVIAADTGTVKPVDAVALSLSCEFLAQAAVEAPDRFQSLTFITPTGFDRRSLRSTQSAGGSREIKALSTFLRIPYLNQGLFDLLVTRPSIRFFLEKTFGSKAIDEGLARYDYLSTHQPGARFAPFAFVSGKLFSTNIKSVYEKLFVPIFMPHGTRGDFQDFSGVTWLTRRPNWHVVPLPTGALPQFEIPDEFNEQLTEFLKSAGADQSDQSGQAAQSSPSSPVS
jgi:pimeloyl-ACP methyl ester carboxylesterase